METDITLVLACGHKEIISLLKYSTIDRLITLAVGPCMKCRQRQAKPSRKD